MASAAKLYTPELLALAAGLADYGWDDALPLQRQARSKSCGSTIALGLEVDKQGRIARVGLRAHACAIGQAAATIFARGAVGRQPCDIHTADAAIAAWLAGEGELPDWPGLEAIAPALAYPGRHGAIRLAWQAARDVLPIGDPAR